jgi:hypothetical protein
VPAVLVGWWYIRLLSVTGSVLGNRGSLTSTGGGSVHGPGLSHLPSIVWMWLTTVYRSYWFDYNAYEMQVRDVWFWLPIVGMILGGIALVVFVVRRIAPRLRDHERPLTRQLVLCAFPAFVLLLPPLGLDSLRATKGILFVTAQGRFINPAYPALAVVLVALLRGFGRRLQAVLVALTVAGAFVVYWHTFARWVLERFYGPAQGHWLRELAHAAWDKPYFITQTSLAAMVVVGVGAFVLAYGLVLYRELPRRRVASTAAQ